MTIVEYLTSKYKFPNRVRVSCTAVIIVRRRNDSRYIINVNQYVRNNVPGTGGRGYSFLTRNDGGGKGGFVRYVRIIRVTLI